MLTRIDLTLFRFINQEWTHPWLDVFFTFITQEETWIPVAIFLSLYLLIKGKKKGRVTFCLLLIAFSLSDLTATRLIKPAVKRIRPSRVLREYIPLKKKQESFQAYITTLDSISPVLEDSLQMLITQVRHYEDSLSLTPEKINALEHIRLLDGYGGKWSFPSNHAANFFSIAAVLTYFYRKRRFIPWIIACLVAYSRVYVGKHYPLDILAGALLGFAIGRLVCVFWQAWLYKRILAKQRKREITSPEKPAEKKLN
ncbi:MAG: phosphatase PAP2 family protein [Candidatus Marinimicrobia bacterium]|nr:phosphatase PAP2 family protein [Candidatus Neomarinimicrobiota bacterium]MDD5582820.1 phosphatase PAP2 family protein [Candidatus Neomarinimicrobiota bacterium]